eukprot:TRINITY_DN1939_c0_g1_i1.p1 TRINITY_DN1939_c0_g1~~TRINITY_DN1939_c0_g1_i1.p1  ORF type:complete len:681 (-),score=96.07 TRINITY_DN1939_c0_g1_i1:353-2395(-)
MKQQVGGHHDHTPPHASGNGHQPTPSQPTTTSPGSTPAPTRGSQQPTSAAIGRAPSRSFSQGHQAPTLNIFSSTPPTTPHFGMSGGGAGSAGGGGSQPNSQNSSRESGSTYTLRRMLSGPDKIATAPGQPIASLHAPSSSSASTQPLHYATGSNSTHNSNSSTPLLSGTNTPLTPPTGARQDSSPSNVLKRLRRLIWDTPGRSASWIEDEDQLPHPQPTHTHASLNPHTVIPSSNTTHNTHNNNSNNSSNNIDKVKSPDKIMKEKVNEELRRERERMEQTENNTGGGGGSGGGSTGHSGKKHKSNTGRVRPRITHEALLNESLRSLHKSNPLATRLKFVLELCDFVQTYRVEDVTKLWAAVKDLVSPTQSPEIRDIGFRIMRAIIKGQYNDLGMLRIEFFRIIQMHPYDYYAKFKTLVALTQKGLIITPFEEEIGYLLVAWLELNLSAEHLEKLLMFIVRIVQYNAKLLPEDALAATIRQVCIISNNTADLHLVQSCLKFFDVLVRYGWLPPQSLFGIVSALCRTLNIETCCQLSWSTMTNILRSQVCGHQAIYELCRILADPYNTDPANTQTVNLLRGAIFYLGMSCWGSFRVEVLHITRMSILPYFLSVLSSEHNIVAYEVALSIRRLIKKYIWSGHASGMGNTLADYTKPGPIPARKRNKRTVLFSESSQRNTDYYL